MYIPDKYTCIRSEYNLIIIRLLKLRYTQRIYMSKLLNCFNLEYGEVGGCLVAHSQTPPPPYLFLLKIAIGLVVVATFKIIILTCDVSMSTCEMIMLTCDTI